MIALYKPQQFPLKQLWTVIKKNWDVWVIQSFKNSSVFTKLYLLFIQIQNFLESRKRSVSSYHEKVLTGITFYSGAQSTHKWKNGMNNYFFLGGGYCVHATSSKCLSRETGPLQKQTLDSPLRMHQAVCCNQKVFIFSSCVFWWHLPLYISSIGTSSRYAVIVTGSLHPRFINNCLTMDHILHSDVLCSSVSLSLIAESVGLMGSWSVRAREDSVLEGLEGDHLIIRLHVIMTCVCVWVCLRVCVL